MKNSFLFLLLNFLSYSSNLYNSESRVVPQDSPAATKYNPHYIDHNSNNNVMAFDHIQHDDGTYELQRNLHDDVCALQNQTAQNNHHKLLSALETLDLPTESTWKEVKEKYETFMKDNKLVESMQQIKNIDHAFLIVRELQGNLAQNSQESQALFRKKAENNPQAAFDMLHVSKYAPWEEIIGTHNNLMITNQDNPTFKNKLLIATEILDRLNHQKKLPSHFLAQRVQKEPAKIIEELELPRDAAWRSIQGKILDLYEEHPHYKHKWNIIMTNLSELNNNDKLPCQQLAKIRKDIQLHPEKGFNIIKLPIDTNWDTIRQRIDTLSVTNPQGTCTLAILREEYMHMFMDETLPYQLLEKFRQNIQQYPYTGFTILSLPIDTSWDTIHQTIDERSHTEQQPLGKCKLAILREEYKRMYEENQLPYQQQALLDDSRVPSPVSKEDPLPFCQEESNTPSPIYEDDTTSPLYE